MPPIPESKPYRIGRSRTGLGLFATKPIKKGTKIIRYFGPLLDAHNEKHDAIENKYLFQINKRWTIDGSIRKNIARYINHSCKPNAESDVNVRKRKVTIRAIKKIEPGDEINYDYGTEYFKAFLKPIGCKCDACEKKRAKKAAAAKAERAADKAKSNTGKASGAKTKKAKGAVADKVKTKAKTKTNAKTKAAADKAKTKAAKTKAVNSKAGKSNAAGNSKAATKAKAVSNSKAVSKAKSKAKTVSKAAKATARATTSKAKAKSATKSVPKAKPAKRPAASKRTRKA